MLVISHHKESVAALLVAGKKKGPHTLTALHCLHHKPSALDETALFILPGSFLSLSDFRFATEVHLEVAWEGRSVGYAMACTGIIQCCHQWKHSRAFWKRHCFLAIGRARMVLSLVSPLRGKSGPAKQNLISTQLKASLGCFCMPNVCM